MKIPKPRYRRPDLTAPVVFALTTLLGVIYIVAAKLLGFHPALVTMFPVLLMSVYALVVIFARRLRLRDDQTGDNFYYMGFIFTLTSLAISLYQFGRGGHVDEIVSNFGIAVSSTIAGIAFRIFFNQVRRDPVEVEQASRLDLADASRKVRRELDVILQELAHFRRTNQQMLDEGYSEIRTKLTETADAMLAEIDRFSKEALFRLSNSGSALDNAFDIEGVRRQVNDTTSSIRSLNDALLSAGRDVSASATIASQKLAAMSTPDRVIEVSMAPVIEDLRLAIEALIDRLEPGTGEVKKLRAELEAATARIERLGSISPRAMLEPLLRRWRRVDGE